MSLTFKLTQLNWPIRDKHETCRSFVSYDVPICKKLASLKPHCWKCQSPRWRYPKRKTRMNCCCKPIVMSELYALIDHIHRTNAIAVMPDGATMLSTLVKRVMNLPNAIARCKTAIDTQTEGDRYSHREIKWQKWLKPVKPQNKQMT